MTQIFNLDVFRRTGDRKAALDSDDGVEVKRAATASVPTELNTVSRGAGDDASSQKGEANDQPSVVFRSVVNEVICRANLDYEELVARLSRLGGSTTAFASRRAELEPAIAAIYSFFPEPAKGSRERSVVLTGQQYEKIEQLYRDYATLLFEISTALKRAQESA
jgi:hypothetical protein